MLSEVRRQPNGVEAPHVCGAASAACEGISTTTQLNRFSCGWPILEMLSRFNSAVTATEFPSGSLRTGFRLGCASLPQDDRVWEGW